jgi:hypothetical protein
MNHFYQYLQNLEEYNEALIMFGLHADIRIYMRMYEEREFFTRENINHKAVQIFEDYIIEDCKWAGQYNQNLSHNGSGEFTSEGKPFQPESPIPIEILREIRAGYSNGKIRFILNNGLFSDLYIFTLERLRRYYDDFKLSRQFVRLRDEVIS